MSERDLNCKDERRRHKVREAEQVNGLDYLEVSNDQRMLSLYFLDKAPKGLKRENVVIEGGRRIKGVKVTGVETKCRNEPDRDDCMTVLVDKPGDFSTYTLKLVEAKDGKPTDRPLRGFDPRYSSLEFSFKVNCPSDFDCAQPSLCPPGERAEPEIDYLAKDYRSFRQLILDRLSLVMPDWKERHAPDAGIALVEIMAYVGDYLSYYQDAVATEAYLDTARLRISVRRHARLVDYRMHEGTNARAWVTIRTDADVELDTKDIFFITSYRDGLDAGLLKAEEVEGVPESRYEVFEPMAGKRIRLERAQNEIGFYTWGDRLCCLPRGATSATLKDEWVDGKGDLAYTDEAYTDQAHTDEESQQIHSADKQHEKRRRKTRLRNIAVGDVLIFEEVKGPKTADPDDADPSHRHAVRLTGVRFTVDELYDHPVVEIEWAAADALPFTLCVSAIGPAPDCLLVEEISIARGNCVLVDHGRRLEPEDLGGVAAEPSEPTCEAEGQPSDVTITPRRFKPLLKRGPLTFSQPYRRDLPAAFTLRQDPRLALPRVELTNTEPIQNDPIKVDWETRQDLFASDGEDRHFVAEIDNEGRAHLRFGDGEMGRMPEAGLRFWASYRVGNGPAGIVGAEAIKHIILRRATLSGVRLEPRNPMPSEGGAPMEPLDEVKAFAPRAFRKLIERAVTAEDYARLAERHPGVERAMAALRWNGSWQEVLVAIDPINKVEADEKLLAEIEGHLHRYQRAGHDLVVGRARYVPLEIEMTVCVLPHYLRGHVKAALLEAFSNRVLADGRRGFFHPDNLTFGEGIPLSKIVAYAQSVPGVETVKVTMFERRGEGPNQEIENGILPLGPMEIARVDNDPNYPENGRMTLDIRGGR